MDQITQHHFDLRFRCAFLEKKGAAFQDFFAVLMSKVHPVDFIPSRPWGKLGDKKNDGYLKSARTLFQVYAPDALKASEVEAKIDEDFRGALPYWEKYFDRWVFVHNAQGLGPHATKKLLDLQGEFPHLKVDQWGYEELRREFWKLSVEDMATWFGAGVQTSNVPGLRFVFERRPQYPELRFSLANHTAGRVQVAALRVVRAGAVKDERSDVRFSCGPRMRFLVNFSETKVGVPVELFGQHTVCMLASGEADAFSVTVECQNTLNLIDFEAEIVSSHEEKTIACYPQQMFVLRTGKTPFRDQAEPGFLVEISRAECMRGLFDLDACRPVAERLEITPEFLQDLLLRGAAFVCRGSLWASFVELGNRYRGSDSWGSVLLSYVEYDAHWHPVRGLQQELEAWLTDPVSIAAVGLWDNECRTREICILALRRLGREQAAALCLRILDRTSGFMECRDAKGDKSERDDFIACVLMEIAVHGVIAEAFQKLFEIDARSAEQVGVVMALISHADGIWVQEVFESAKKTSVRIPKIGASAKDWQEWECSEEIQALCGKELAWKQQLPRLAAAAGARLERHHLASYVEHAEVFARVALCGNPYLTKDLMCRLACDSSIMVKRALAHRIDLPQEAWCVMLETGDETIRNWHSTLQRRVEKA